MFKFLLTGFFSLIILVQTGCSTVKIKDYEQTRPEFHIEDYFQGNTTAWGVFQDRFGKVRRTFTVDIKGEWDPENRLLTLDEDFIYDDGQTEKRIWKITKTSENTYEGSAGGVIGTAKGKSAGNAFHWRYDFNLPVEGSTWKVNFDDWLYKLDEDTVFNKAVIRRWGIRLGDVYIFFKKRPDN